MPFYEFDLTIPARTPATAPVRTVARLNKGHITALEVHFPPGCAGLVLTTAERGEAQVWPSNPDGSFKGDGRAVAWDDDYPLADQPLELVLLGWAPSSRFAHTVTWRFELLPLDQAQEQAAAPGLLRRLAESLLGRD